MSRVLASLACVGLLLVSGAQIAAAATKAKSHEVRGEVVKADAAAGSLVVKTVAKGKTHQLSFVVGSDAKLMRGKEAVGLADLRPGETVTVTYRTKDKQNHAERITVAAGAAKRPVSAPPKKATQPMPEE